MPNSHDEDFLFYRFVSKLRSNLLVLITIGVVRQQKSSEIIKTCFSGFTP